MFRRRDVSELLKTNQSLQEDLVQEAAEIVEAEEPQEAAPRPQPRRMTLAQHFADQQVKPAPMPTVAASSYQAPPRKPLGIDKSRAQAGEPAKAPLMTPAMDEDDDRLKRVLTVGPETCLKGEISKCDRVVIEGQVDADMAEVDLLVISEGGQFRGTAKAANAEISGSFNGDLTVTGKLVVYEKGLLNGKISYSEIQVMRGGRIVGQLSCMSEFKDTLSVPTSVIDAAKDARKDGKAA